MPNRLLVSEKQIKEMSIVDHNVNPNILNQLVNDVQELQLKPILGDTLYEQFLSDIDAAYTANPTNPTLTEQTKALYKAVRGFIIAAVLVDFVSVDTYKFANAGVQKLNATNGQAISMLELENLKRVYMTHKQQYKQQLIEFLQANKLGDGKDRNSTSTDYGFYFPKDECEGGTGDDLANFTKAGNVLSYTKAEIDALLANLSVGIVEWNNVTNKPTTFTPSAHTHQISDVLSLQSTLDSKASIANTYSKTQVDTLIDANNEQTAIVALVSGINTVLQFDRTKYKGARISYVLYDANMVNMRIGDVAIISNGSVCELYHVSSVDIGDVGATEIRAEMNMVDDTFDLNFYFVPDDTYSVSLVPRKIK